jgi:hypothetical protein
VFAENNGPVRRIVWFFAYLASTYGVYFLVADIIRTYVGAFTATSIEIRPHDGLFPMVTICSRSPVRCGCGAFYHPDILSNATLAASFFPYICAPLIAFSGSAPADLTAAPAVDADATIRNMANFAGAIDCDRDGHTAAALVRRARAGGLTLQDVYAYAGDPRLALSYSVW